MAADLIKKVLAFPLSSLNFKGLSFCFEGLTYVYMLLTFSFQCHFRFILINILGWSFYRGVVRNFNQRVPITDLVHEKIFFAGISR